MNQTINGYSESNALHINNKSKQNAKEWCIKSSHMAQNTINPIRKIVDQMKLTPNPDKYMIALSIGDPTVFGNHDPSEKSVEAVIDVLKAKKHNGYAPSVGYEDARAAIARYSSTDGFDLTAKDIIITHGCSSALDICISVIANAGQNILIPRPGFSVYMTLAHSLGIRTKSYNLLPERNWQVDLVDMESQIDENTVAILMNNPSNPCGSVFSHQHLTDIAAIAEKYRLPIIADEIYAHFVFEGYEYSPMASVNDRIPILSCGGLTKRFLVPGWRTGWIAVYDKNGHFDEIRKGILALTTRTLGCNTLVQGAMKTILEDTDPAFFVDTLDSIQINAAVAYSNLSKIPGLHPVKPQGAMYMMVGVSMRHFPAFSNDLQFTEQMVTDQSVFCLPGNCFECPNYFRIVLTVPEEQMREACFRIAEFCASHYKE